MTTAWIFLYPLIYYVRIQSIQQVEINIVLLYLIFVARVDFRPCSGKYRVLDSKEEVTYYFAKKSLFEGQFQANTILNAS